MKLLTSETEFLKSRKKLLFFWKILGPGLSVIYIALVSWLLIEVPMFVNPFSVMTGIENGDIPSSTLSLMAGVLPVVVIAMLAVMASLILFSFCAFSRERKYLEIIDNQEYFDDQKIL